MTYNIYPYEVKFRYLVRKNQYSPILAGFLSEKDAADYALSIGGTVLTANPNPRNAGRDPIYSDREKDAIRERIRQGIPLRSIAAEFQCSVGYVHKLKCEQPL